MNRITIVLSAIRDRVLVWPTVLTIVWAVALVSICSGPVNLALFGGMIVLGIATLSAVPALALAVGFAIERGWSQLLSALVLPVAILITWLNMHAVWQSAILAGGYAHLTLMRPFYLYRISKFPVASQPNVTFFDWDGLTSVVFDETDEVASSHPSEAWKERIGLPCGVTQVNSAGGHFYVVRLGC